MIHNEKSGPYKVKNDNEKEKMEGKTADENQQ